jgi:protein-disulfide isomerase
LLGTAGLALLAVGGAAVWRTGMFEVTVPAAAQAPSNEELMKAGALTEMSQGNVEAPVTVIEYASMTCSHCADFAVNTFPELKKRYIDTGKVRYILREFPLDPVAAAGFMLARCAGDGKYFDVVDLLFHQQRDWAFAKNPLQGLSNVAKQAGVTGQAFEQCLANQKLLDDIESVRSRGAEKFGVNSTPTFFINGKIQRGAMPIDELAKLIDPYLKG